MKASVINDLSLLVPTTILLWVAGVATYGYLWVNYHYNNDVLYGYERSRLLISSAFLAYRMPLLFAVLVVVLLLEVFLSSWFVRRSLS